MTNRRLFLGLATGLALTMTGNLVIAQSKPTGPILLTVTGAVENANRGAYDPAHDKFFGYNEVEFTQATQFDYDALTALDMVKIMADFPKGGVVYEYEGPLLADVLGAAGAKGSKVTIQALDGYAVEMDAQTAIDQGAVVALKRDGAPLSIGGYGPTHVVFPRAERSDLSEMSDDNWIWSIFHIQVE